MIFPSIKLHIISSSISLGIYLYFWSMFILNFPRNLSKKYSQETEENIFWRNCTLLTCGLARFNNTYPWFKSYHLTHLRWPLLDPHYPPLSFSLKNPLYYISHNKNWIRSNILKNDFSITILEIKSSNPNLISWPESCSINTIIGSLLMYILPTIYIKSCQKKKKTVNLSYKPRKQGKTKRNP